VNEKWLGHQRIHFVVCGLKKASLYTTPTKMQYLDDKTSHYGDTQSEESCKIFLLSNLPRFAVPPSSCDLRYIGDVKWVELLWFQCCMAYWRAAVPEGKVR